MNRSTLCVTPGSSHWTGDPRGASGATGKRSLRSLPVRMTGGRTDTGTEWDRNKFADSVARISIRKARSEEMRNRVRNSPEFRLFLLSSFPHFLRNSAPVSWRRVGKLFRPRSQAAPSLRLPTTPDSRDSNGIRATLRSLIAAPSAARVGTNGRGCARRIEKTSTFAECSFAGIVAMPYHVWLSPRLGETDCSSFPVPLSRTR